MSTFTSNWFTDKLPIEVEGRYDGKFNVWNLTPIVIDDETDLKWQVIGVFDTKAEAETFAKAQ